MGNTMRGFFLTSTFRTPTISASLMATGKVVISLIMFFFALAMAMAEDSRGQVLKGSVSCLDCKTASSDLSGLQVLVKCDKVKKLAVAYTEEDGTFQTELPSDEPTTPSRPGKCVAKIMGGPYQLYTPAKYSLVPVAESKGSHYFATAKPLSFYKSCPQEGRCGAKDMGFASSKTVDLPLPREWGLAPSSYYIPFIPIIGIP